MNCDTTLNNTISVMNTIRNWRREKYINKGEEIPWEYKTEDEKVEELFKNNPKSRLEI